MKLIISICLLSLLLPAFARAQSIEEVLQNSNEAAVVEDVEGLRAVFKEYTQDPDSKIVKYEMTLKSNIDSDRVKVTWTLRGVSSFLDKTQASKNITVVKDKTYSIIIELLPGSKGVTELVGKAEAFTVNGNFVATVRKNFAINSDLEILPLTDDYNSAKRFSTIRNLVITAVILIAIGAGLFYAFKKIRFWLSRP